MTPLEELALFALDRACEPDSWGESEWELREEAVRLGLFRREPYDPDKHGDDCGGAEPGQEITVWYGYAPLTEYRARKKAGAR